MRITVKNHHIIAEKCTGLDTQGAVLTIPDGVTVIGDLEVWGANKYVPFIHIPESVEIIEHCAFNGWRGNGNSTITIPANVRRIGWGAFLRTGVKRANVPEGCNIRPGAFEEDCEIVRYKPEEKGGESLQEEILLAEKLAKSGKRVFDIVGESSALVDMANANSKDAGMGGK